jgi:hypothetical protein
MKGKRALELSINFLVIIIFSLGILGLSVALFNKFFRGAQDIQENYDKQTEEEMEKLLLAGKKVAIPFIRKEVQPGESAVFGLGILSVRSAATTYYITVDCAKAFDPSGGFLACNLWQTAVNNPLLQNNEQAKIPIVIPTEHHTQRGTYIFNVAVCPDSWCMFPYQSSQLYDGNVHKLYLKVV